MHACLVFKQASTFFIIATVTLFNNFFGRNFSSLSVAR